MTEFELDLCTHERKCNIGAITCPPGPNEAKYPHEECHYLYSHDAFQCLSRGDKYPSMFEQGIFDKRSRTQRINLYTHLEFNEKGFKCNDRLWVGWENFIQLNNVENCKLIDGTLIPTMDLIYLIIHDMGFNGRQWLSTGQKR